jgi:hypothetical protein
MRKLLAAFSILSVAALQCDSGTIGGGDPNNPIDPNGTVDMRPAFDRDAACGTVKAQATLTKAPVDVIFVIDNSGSMQSEIIAVQNNINQNFAQIIQNSGIDYRIIMISRHGRADPDESICINAPLAGNTSCNPVPARPTNTSRFFHYSTEVASQDSYTVIRTTYNAPDEFNLAPQGWSQWLRPNAMKTFIEITDDNSSVNEVTFENQLFALTPKMFGDATKRNYIFHAICGVVENNPVNAAWPPTAAVQTNKCTTNGGDSVNSSQVHQRLAIRTGGLRFPICQYTSFDSVFQEVARGVVTGAQVSCNFPVPTAPMGKKYVLETAQLEYTPGNGGATKILNQVPNANACAPNSFYIENNQVNLCGASCDEVTADSGAKIEFLLECLVQIG